MRRVAVTAVRLGPMAPGEFRSWSRRSVRGFAAQQVAAGLNCEAEATSYAEEQLAHLLTDGLATPGHLLWTVHLDDGATAGHLWMRLLPTPDGVEAYVLDVEIVPEARGRGLGRATMLAAEAAAGDLGATEVRLNAFGHNTPAMSLYARLGYTVERATLSLRLDGTSERVGGTGVTLREMTSQEYDAIRRHPVEELTDAVERLLPHGPATSGHRLWEVERDGAEVGWVWLSLQHRPDGLHARIRHLEVSPRHRCRGHGRSALLAVSRAAQDLGVRALWFESGDAEARSFLVRSGFAVRAQTMRKPL